MPIILTSSVLILVHVVGAIINTVLTNSDILWFREH